MGRGSGTHNPYTPDSGARPPALTGRNRELAHLRSIISQLSAGGTEQHVLITGLRGVGKTVLLNEFEGMCEEAGWPAEAKEVSAVGGAAAEAGVGFALILDEVQNLDRHDYEALIMALHRAKQRNLPVSFVGAGPRSSTG